MTSRIRTAALAVVTALGLVAAPVALAAPAAAVTYESNVVFFSNAEYTDPAEEDATQIAALTAAGATVTVFDGGDGSAAVWSAILTGQQALVFPESDSVDPDVLSEEAAEVLLAFAANGGVIILPTSYQAPLLSFLTGVDYASVWDEGDSGSSPWTRQFADEAFPAELNYSNGTYPVSIAAWTEEELAGFTPLYSSDDNVAVGAFAPAEGSGVIYTLAYDWFPGTNPEDISAREVWNVVLGLLLPFVEVAPAPAPELAATGSSVESGAFIAGAALLLLAGAALLATRRKASA